MAIWPFGRRRDNAGAAPEPGAPDPVSPSSGEADVARPERTPTGDWMTLAPVATAMSQPMPTTFRVQRLAEILTSHQDTRLSGSLGHQVSVDAPSGTIGGLAEAAGSVSYEGSRAPSELRDPYHAPAPAELPAPLVQRRLATTADAAPLTVAGDGAPLSTAAPPAPALPEPAVSRVLAHHGPLPAPSAGAAPLPIARVVDGGVTASAASPASTAPPSALAASAAAPTATGDPSDAGLVGDDRVGGFEVDLGSLLGGDRLDPELPVINPPPDLAPPIQRSVRRTGAGAAPVPPPLRAPIQRAVDPTPTAPLAEPAGPSTAPTVHSPTETSSTAPTVHSPTETSTAPTVHSPTETSTAATADAAAATSAADAAAPPTGAGAPLPPIQRLASDPAVTPASPLGTAHVHGPSPAGPPDIAVPATDDAPSSPAGADRPLAGDARAGLASRSAPLAASAGSAAADSGSIDLPLASPTVQRVTDGGTAATPATSVPGRTPGSTPVAGPSPASSDSDAGASAAGAAAVAQPDPGTAGAAAGVQRAADIDATSVGTPAVPREADAAAGYLPGDDHDHDDAGPVQRSVGTASTAPLTGAAPLTTSAELGAVDGGGGGDDEARASDVVPGGLPLVARVSEATAPTLGANAEASALPLQTLSDDAAPATTGGTSSLPLAPVDGPGTLAPPAGNRPPTPAASTTGLVGDAPLAGPGGLAASSSAATSDAGGAVAPRSLVAPRQPNATAAPSTTPGAYAGTTPLVAQRAAAPAPGRAPAAASAPLASSGGSLLLAAPATGGGATVAPAPMTVLGGIPAEAPAVPLQRTFDAPLVAPASPGPGAAAVASATAAGRPASTTASPSAAIPTQSDRSVPAPSSGDAPISRMPLAGTGAAAALAGSTPTPLTEITTQRSVDPGTAGAHAGSGSPMPLHTAASSVPSTTDLLVKAGLGEKGPNGSFLRSTPPAGVEAAFTVQAVHDVAAPPATAVQRAEQVSAATVSSAPTGDGEGGGGGGREDVRKLYLKIRAELEADLRRQLEAKSRYNRYRP